MRRIMKSLGNFTGILLRYAKNLRNHPMFANLSLVLSSASIVIAMLSFVIGLTVTVMISEDTNEIVIEEADTSRREIVTAIETSSAEVKETIKTSNESLGTKIEASNEALGVRNEASNSLLTTVSFCLP